MTKKFVVSLGLLIYILILITFHRFENSQHALEILGNIPTVVSAIATSLAFIIAVVTYISNIRIDKSKTAYTAYKEVIDNLNAILSDKTNDNSYKIFYISIAFDSLVKIEPLVTEKEHKNILSSSHVAVKHHIINSMKSLEVNEYFSSEIAFQGSYKLNISSCANALCEYWQQHVAGKSVWAKATNGNMDCFASHPYGIDSTLLMKAFAIILSEPTQISSTYGNIYQISKNCTSQHGKIIDEMGNISPLAISYILLCNQTESVIENNELKLRLKSTQDETYWFKHDLGFMGWVTTEIPEYFK